MLEDVGGAGVGQPVADHGERLQVGRVFHRQHLQGIGAVAAGARLQAGAGEQGGQGFLRVYSPSSAWLRRAAVCSGLKAISTPAWRPRWFSACSSGSAGRR